MNDESQKVGSVRMRYKIKAEDWKGCVGYTSEPVPSLDEIRAANEAWKPAIATWQRHVNMTGGGLTSIEVPAVEAAQQMSEYIDLLLNTAELAKILKERIEEHDARSGAPECYKIGSEIE